MRTLVLALLASLALSATAQTDQQRLARVLIEQPEETQQRYYFRHPLQTLNFFEIEPGMTVVEALPGDGWYSKILIDYLGSEGQLVGVDYALDMFPKFGFFSEERIKAKETWVADWTKQANGWRGDDSAEISAFVFGSMPESARNSADRILFIRAMHNLARFEKDGGYMTTALSNAFDVLKSGGIMGVVQHEARPERDDKFASGARGYLKKHYVIAQAEAAGFKYIGESDINRNEADIPGVDEMVWRLPPNLSTSREDPRLRLRMMSVGESNRMTLKFRKP